MFGFKIVSTKGMSSFLQFALEQQDGREWISAVLNEFAVKIANTMPKANHIFVHIDEANNSIGLGVDFSLEHAEKIIDAVRIAIEKVKANDFSHSVFTIDGVNVEDLVGETAATA